MANAIIKPLKTILPSGEEVITYPKTHIDAIKDDNGNSGKEVFNNLVETIKTEFNEYTDTKVAAEVTARDAAITAAKEEVNKYTDEKVAAIDHTEAIDNALASAKTYTDEKVAAEVTARDEAIAAAKEEVNKYTDEQIASMDFSETISTAKTEANTYTDEKIAEVNTTIENLSNVKVDVNQGTENAGLPLVVSDDGNVKPAPLTFSEFLLTDVDNGYTYRVQMKGGSLVSSCICEKIEVTTLPTKMSYGEGEEFDPTGMVVTGTCMDGTTITISDYTYALDGSVVTVSYSEGGNILTDTFEIVSVCAKIEITTLPTKTHYEQVEDIDTTGMVVTGTRADGSTFEVSDYTCTLNETTVTVSYVEGDNTFTDTFEVTFACEKIEVTTLPTKTDYIEGAEEEFISTGMVVTGTRVNGSTFEVTDYTSVLEGSTVTVSYVEGDNTFTDTFEINFISLQDFTYTMNDDGTYTITGWNQTLNGEESTEMVIPDSNSIIL